MKSAKRKIKPRELAELACLLALAMMVSYIEVLIPIPLGIPGAKLGLANVVIVFALYKIGPRGALVINVSRVLLCALLFGNLYSMLYSLVGALASLGIMVLFKSIKAFGMMGVSIAGGVAHNIGQLILALLITQVPVLLYYVPFLLVVGAVTGVFNGGLAKLLYARVQKYTNETAK